MKGFVFVGAQGLESDDDLEEWIQFGQNFVRTLPKK